MTVQAGDIGFSHTDKFFSAGKLIQIGEALRGERGSEWNHEFAVSDEVDVDGVPFVIQATMKGVTDTCRLDEVARDGRYITMPPPDAVDRHEFLTFMKSQVGVPYGLWTDISIGIDMISWNWFPSFRSATKPSWQCSALVNEGLRFAGWLHEWPNIYIVTPQDGYRALVQSK